MVVARLVISRLKQGLRAIFAAAHPVDDQAVAAILSPPQMLLFKRMRRVEQLHSLRVMRTLLAQGHHNPDLLVAALLHDCGKSRYRFTLVERVVVVLAKRLLPAAFARWSMAKPEGWRRMFVISAQHSQWSAEDMEQAGAPALAVTLARRHQHRVEGVPTCEEDRLLVALQSADDDN
jgi:hypothetical protein